MAMATGTVVSFTANLSGVLSFSGMVKIKADDIPQGESVKILEETTAGEYDYAISEGKFLEIAYPDTSDVFYLMGNYKLERTVNTISVGYVE